MSGKEEQTQCPNHLREIFIQIKTTTHPSKVSSEYFPISIKSNFVFPITWQNHPAV